MMVLRRESAWAETERGTTSITMVTDRDDVSPNQDDRRARVLLHARDLLSAWDAYKGDKTLFRMSQVEEHAETLFAFLVTAFNGEITAEQTRTVLAQNRDYLSADVLADMPDAYVPIAVVRAVLFKHRVMFNPTSTKHWSVFNKRYGRFLQAV